MKKVFKFFKWTALSIIAIILIILIPIGINKVYQNIRSSFLSNQEKNKEDLERFEFIMKNEFSGYGVLPTTNAFDEKLNHLKNVLNDTAKFSKEFSLEIIKAVAAFKDPHTAVYNKNELLDSRFPYSLTWSNGDFYLLSGQVEKKWLGAKVIKFENIPGKLVFEKLSAYTNAPNEAGTAFFISSFVYSPDVLYYEGIITDRNKIQLEVTHGGETSILTFNSLPKAQFDALTDFYRMDDKFSDYDKPLYKTRPGQNYWYEFNEAEKLFYLRYKLCVAQGDIEALWNEVFEKLNTLKPEKLVIDVRENPGGDTQNHSRFLSRLAKDTLVNREGKLFTLIDRGTGSSAVSFASDMERITETILVGEQTMDKPNTTADPTFFTLPHSKVTIVLPNLYSFNSHIYDKRDAVIPDIPIVQNIEGDAYLYDEVMDSVINLRISAKANNFATLPSNLQGQYSFSPIRNASLIQRDSIWYISIDGLLDAPILQTDSMLYTRKYNIKIASIDSVGKELKLIMHNSQINLTRIDDNDISLVQSITDRKFEKTKSLLEKMQGNGNLPYYLGRPLFQSRTYIIYNQYGFNSALEFNKLTKQFCPNDPVASIVDYELNEYENNTLGQVKSIFPVIENFSIGTTLLLLLRK